ncbi:MAG TPA: hypothetical protein ENI64_04585 [Gammaproteobacteria bacterium]|nr:hypothetical protein [Gammaproteobacteria bacterium]
MPGLVLADQIIELEQKQVDSSGISAFYFQGEMRNAQTYEIVATEGVVWVGTNKGLVRYDLTSKQWLLVSPPAGVEQGVAYQLAANEAGQLAVEYLVWTGADRLNSAGIFLFDDVKKYWVKIQDRGSSDIQWRGRELWVLSRSGISIYDIDAGKAWDIQKDLPSLYRRSSLGKLITDDYGVWIAVTGRPIALTGRFEKGGVIHLQLPEIRWKSYDYETGLAQDAVSDIAGDYQQIVAVHGQADSGISLLDVRQDVWRTLMTSANDIPLGGRLVVQDEKYIWTAYSGGLTRLQRGNNQATQYTSEDGLPGNVISGMASGLSGLWVAAFDYSGDEQGISYSGVAKLVMTDASPWEDPVLQKYWPVIMLVLILLSAMLLLRKRKHDRRTR